MLVVIHLAHKDCIPKNVYYDFYLSLFISLSHSPFQKSQEKDISLAADSESHSTSHVETGQPYPDQECGRGRGEEREGKGEVREIEMRVRGSRACDLVPAHQIRTGR